MKTILFIGHDARRAGSQILAHDFLKALLTVNKDTKINIVLKNDGEIVKSFREIGDTFIMPSQNEIKSDTLKQILFKLGLLDFVLNFSKKKHKQKFIEFIKSLKTDLILANTIAVGDILEQFDFEGIPIISYIHELEMGFEMYSNPESVAYQLAKTDLFFVPSNSVKQNLIANHNKLASSITIIPSLISVPKNITETKIELFSKLNIPLNSVVVGASGTIDVRKNPEAFIDTAEIILNRTQKSVYFIWLGGDQDVEMYFELQEKIKKLGKEDKILFVKPTNEPQNYYNIFDIFYLCSKEDPYPLVVLEAAFFKNPSVCFEGSGGAVDFIETDCGFIVPYLDNNEASKKIELLIENEQLRLELGQNAYKKLELRHDTKKSVRIFAENIKNALILKKESQH